MCLLSDLIGVIKSGDFLTYLGIVLAYIAYTWSVNRDLDSWKSLFISFKIDLEAQQRWLSTPYREGKYEDKQSYSPKKLVFPLSFESLPEIIRRGADGLPFVPSEVINRLSIFNERITAFNSALKQVQLIVTADPVKTEKLIDLLNEMEIDKEKVLFDKFKKKIIDGKKDNELLYIAENIRRIHKIIHTKLIGDENRSDGLYSLYSKIYPEILNITKNFDEQRPSFIKNKIWIICLSFFLFIAIELNFR